MPEKKIYFASDQLLDDGLPNIQQCGDALNMSGHYLSDLLNIKVDMVMKDSLKSIIRDQDLSEAEVI